MYDVLPFPRFTGKTAEEQVSEITSYLIQLKEVLEFELTDISTENLSRELVDKLNSLGASIEKIQEDEDANVQQIKGSPNRTSVSDIVNSSLFQNELNKAVETKVKSLVESGRITVNLDTGKLEYN